jgi:outer membrane cobalamin receptor
MLCVGASQSSAQTTVVTLDEVVATASRTEESRREITSNGM